MTRDDAGADYFTRLEATLASGTRRGDHLVVAPRRFGRIARRTVAAAALILALAFSLASEFPASARGQVTAPVTASASAAHLGRDA